MASSPESGTSFLGSATSKQTILSGVSQHHQSHEIPQSSSRERDQEAEPSQVEASLEEVREKAVAIALADFLMTAAEHCLTPFHISTLVSRTSIFNLGRGLDWIVDICNTTSGEAVAVKHSRVERVGVSSSVPAASLSIRKARKELLIALHPPLKAHQNIVDILGYGWEYSTEGTSIPCLVVEYATQGTLRQYLQTNIESISDAARLGLCTGAVRGLDAIHECGIIHGDMKMENVLVVSSLQGATAKLADFGLSIIPTPGQTMGTYWGTEGYLAPEIAENRDTQSGFVSELSDLKRCDIFATGLLLFEALMDGAFIRDIWSKPAHDVCKRHAIFDVSPGSQNTLHRWRAANSTSFGSLERAIESSLKYDTKTRGSCAEILELLQSWVPTPASLEQIPLLSHHGESEVAVIDLSDDPTFFSVLIARGAQSSSLASPPWDVQAVLSRTFSQQTKSSDSAFSASMHLTLAVCHYVGFGVERNPDQVKMHLELAASKGSAKARLAYAQICQAMYTNFGIPDPLANKNAGRSEESDGAAFPPPSKVPSEDARLPPSGAALLLVPFLGLVHPATKLQNAVATGNEREVRRLIDEGEFDTLGESGTTALHVACATKNLAMMRLLVHDAMSDPSVTTPSGHTPLHFLAFLKPKDVVEAAELLTSSNSSNVIDIDAFSPTAYRIADDFGTVYGTPLHWAVSCNNLEAVKVLISLGASVHATKGKFSPIETAASIFLWPILEVLLSAPQASSSVAKSRERGFFFLDEAHPFRVMVIHGAGIREAVQNTVALLEKHDDVNGLNNLEWSPLYKLALFNVSPISEIAVDCILPKSNLQPHLFDHSLVIASIIGCKGSSDASMSQIALKLIDAGASLQKCSSAASSWPGWNALHWAVGSNNLAIAEAIISRAPALLKVPTENTDDGELPIHIASQVDGGRKMLQLLLRHGADVGARTTKLGYTPLGTFIGSASRGKPDYDVLNLLLDETHSTPLSARTGPDERQNALHLAADRSGHLLKLGLSGTEMIRAILLHPTFTDHPDMINKADDNGMTALHTSAFYFDYAATRCLIEAGADPNMATPRGMTPLSFAMELSRQRSPAQSPRALQDPLKHAYNTAIYLVKKMREIGNETAKRIDRLHVAAYIGYFEEVKRLVEVENVDKEATHEGGQTAFFFLAMSLGHARQSGITLDPGFMRNAGLVLMYLHPNRGGGEDFNS